jgi:LacI family transcriptional regulator
VRPVASFAQLAYVTDYPLKNDPVWGYTDAFFHGARQRGREYGYEVVPFWLREGGMTKKQASSVLFNRGIKGLLIAPLPVDQGRLDLTWKYFSSVALGTSLLSPRLDYAAFDHHESMQVVLEKLHECGYERIGLFLLYRRSARLRYAPLDAYVGHQHRQAPATRLEPLLMDAYSSEEFWAWYDRENPEAIVTDASDRIMDILKERGLRAPRDVGVACVGRFSTENAHISSVTQDLQAIGAAAVDRLHTNLLRSAYGVPEHSYGTLLHGHWAEGTTLKRKR